MKTQIFKTLAIVIVMTFCIIGCTKNDTGATTQPENPQAEYLMPLKVGNTWVYRTTHMDSNNNITHIIVDTFTIIGDTVIKNEPCFILYHPHQSDTNISFLRNTKNGISLYDMEKWVDPIYKYPGKTGEIYYFSLSHKDTVEVKIINTYVPYITPLRIFYCYQYCASTDKTMANMYYCPGIGHIMSEEYKRKNNGERYIYYKQELIDYKLN